MSLVLLGMYSLTDNLQSGCCGWSCIKKVATDSNEISTLRGAGAFEEATFGQDGWRLHTHVFLCFFLFFFFSFLAKSWDLRLKTCATISKGFGSYAWAVLFKRWWCTYINIHRMPLTNYPATQGSAFESTRKQHLCRTLIMTGWRQSRTLRPFARFIVYHDWVLRSEDWVWWFDLRR